MIPHSDRGVKQFDGKGGAPVPRKSDKKYEIKDMR
jgi:hypothetical protein